MVGARRLVTDVKSANRMPPYYLDGPQQFGDPQQFRQAQPGLWPGPQHQPPGPQHQPPGPQDRR
ncbi:hypothetical protein [Kribbella flavida]|uniref:hypothetical protein n=1 Tax=Kribbella flavida TaxID=182640 RepID=UPI00019BDFFB|nr:hypothetical protein [Kribbella flavida]